MRSVAAERRQAVEKVCREWGISEHYSRDGIHGWRCEYEDRYGPCTDFQEFINELMAVIEGPVKAPEHFHSFIYNATGSFDRLPVGIRCSCGFEYGGTGTSRGVSRDREP